MLQILEGDEIQIGLAADDWLEHQKYNYFPPTHPKVVKVHLPFDVKNVKTPIIVFLTLCRDLTRKIQKHECVPKMYFYALRGLLWRRREKYKSEQASKILS